MIRQQNIRMDGNGHFRDDNGQPLVCIFDSQDGRRRETTESSWQRPIIATHNAELNTEESRSHSTRPNPRPLKFVNASRPRQKKRSGTLKPIKSDDKLEQVANKYKTRRNDNAVSDPSKAANTTLCKTAPLSSRNKQHPPNALLAHQSMQYIRNLTIFPIVMKPYMFTLMDFCMYYLSLSLVSTDSVTDSWVDL
jgi:hypothetical protein